ncbi:MAG: efflux RND transporter periplasmic adaptor subunit [Burkholderiaceae bacterium]|jgi:membrane fusion protein, multidrug efflux system|nr:efflux RND transporter periplasmic adaptor subunit [Burkholderiaceae bacterium]MDP4969010.1 efflux RND transporter periplasmic adaptor subunit [Burkholderiaceae bacterium]MDP5111116.1 efflux RND transporter periplasmic adaptor subunit [Burkholderiaceae bacterium]
MKDTLHDSHGLPLGHPDNPNSEIKLKKTLRKVTFFAVLIVALLLFGLASALFDRWTFAEVLAKRTEESALMHVLVVKPTAPDKNSPNMRLVLPGTLRGINEAQIHSRVTGYVKQWFKDLGDTAKQGETLALIDIPEINRQVEEATANFKLAKTVYDRWRRLRAEDAVSQQEMDEKTGLYRQSEAVLNRLKQLQSFGNVTAPFEGRITRRNVNLGDLVNAGNVGNAQAMFSMARTDRLSVYVYLPQDRTSQVKVGDEVSVYQTNAPDKIIKGRIARTAGAIDINTRTLQVDIEIPNENNALLPGAYVEVAMQIALGNSLIVPTNTLIFGAGGPYIAVVDKDNRAEKKKVTLGVDFGNQVEIRSGITADDQLILNPMDSLVNGQAVVPQSPAPRAPSSRRGS